MKKYLLLFTTILISIFWLSKPISAQEASQSADQASAAILQKERLTEEIIELTGIYRGQLAEYRQAEKNFGIDRAQYEKLQTLASIATVTDSAKTVMMARTQVLLTYFELLRVSLVAQEGIELSLKDAVINRLEVQNNWLQIHHQAVKATNNREEFNQLADTFSARLDTFEEIYQEATVLLYVGSLQDVFDRLDALSFDMSELVASESSQIDDRAFKETNLVTAGLKTQFIALWQELTESLEKRRTGSFYNNLAKETNATYADLSKLVSFLDELLRQL